MVLVDTSIWSLVLRRKSRDLNDGERRSRAAMEDLVVGKRVRLIGVVRQELLSGIREAAQYERLRVHLRAYRDVPLTVEDYEEAARMSNHCRSAGITGNISDFLICAVAARREWSVFTMDADFGRYVKHVPLALFSAG
jgi:predicted nucleic acid-binding protein